MGNYVYVIDVFRKRMEFPELKAQAIRLATTRIAEEDVADASLRLAPCVFQAEEQKACEVRLTVMGETLFAARLDSQSLAEATLDFREARNWNDLGCTSIEVPEDVREQVLAFQQRLALNFGTMDFIVTPAGDWVFLETNPLGQFLWVEDANPDMPLLDAFVDFIISGRDDFRYDFCKERKLAMTEFESSLTPETKRFIAAEPSRHVPVTFSGPAEPAGESGLGNDERGHADNAAATEQA